MIRGLLLAGGTASRFGSAKLLHPCEGSPLGSHAARNLVAGVGNALAVVRDGDDALARMLREAGCDVHVTARSREGLGASIAAGVAASRDAAGWVVALADMPRVAPEVSRSIARALEAGALLAAPVLPGGERGHPVGFAASLGDELVALGGDVGARPVFERHRSAMVAVPTEDRGVLYDVDRPEDLALPNGAQLRRATSEDAAAMTALAMRSKAHWGYDAATLESWRESLRIDPAKVASQPAWVATIGGTIVGFHALAPHGESWELLDLWVDPACMGRGIGRTLMGHALAIAWQGGARGVTVDADPNAEAFYVACGAKRVGAVPAPIEGNAARVRPQLIFTP